MIRPVAPADLDALLALNNRHATSLSPLDADRFRRLLAETAFAATADGAACLVLAFDETARYDSPNYRWFQTRYDRFVYVDRVVVAETRRGEGIAGRLYDAVEAEARRTGRRFLGCEINHDPPNLLSDRFHARRGFAELGRATLAGGKTVRYLGRRLAP